MRDVRRCESCGLASRDWVRIALLREGRVTVQFALCLACAADAEDAVRAARRAHG